MHLMDVCALEVFMCVSCLLTGWCWKRPWCCCLTVGDFPTVVWHTGYEFKVGESPLLRPVEMWAHLSCLFNSHAFSLNSPTRA